MLQCCRVFVLKRHDLVVLLPRHTAKAASSNRFCPSVLDFSAETNVCQQSGNHYVAEAAWRRARVFCVLQHCITIPSTDRMQSSLVQAWVLAPRGGGCPSCDNTESWSKLFEYHSGSIWRQVKVPSLGRHRGLAEGQIDVAAVVFLPTRRWSSRLLPRWAFHKKACSTIGRRLHTGQREWLAANMLQIISRVGGENSTRTDEWHRTTGTVTS